MSPGITTSSSVWNAACMRFEIPVSYMPPIHTSRPRERAAKMNLSAASTPPNFATFTAKHRSSGYESAWYASRSFTNDSSRQMGVAMVLCSAASRANARAVDPPHGVKSIGSSIHATLSGSSARSSAIERSVKLWFASSVMNRCGYFWRIMRTAPKLPGETLSFTRQ